MKKESSIAYLNKQAAVTFLLLLVIVLPLKTEAQQRQHLSKYFEGIPVINNTYMGFLNTSQQYQYDSMRAMGVNLFWNGLNASELEFLKNKGIKAIPINTRDATGKVYQWVQYYCDAKYTVWEAEGTNDSEDAGLYRDTGKTEIITGDTTFVRTVPFAQTSKIIYGPYYTQENIYVVQDDSLSLGAVEYTADFELMLQKNNEYPQTDTTVYSMTEPICSLQVTASKIVYRNNNWVIDSVFIIKDTLLTRGSFSGLNTFIKFPLQYTLANVPKEFTTTKYRNNTERVMWSGASTNNIEFKVIWLGREKYRLSLNKITVYDYRGLEIKTDSLGVARKIEFEEIGTIRNSNPSAYDSTVLGWHGIDEVVSIDNFEPIRIVAGILKQQDLRLYLPMMGFWNGTWENGHFVKNPYGSNGQTGAVRIIY